MPGIIKVLDVIPSLAVSRTKDVSNGGSPVCWGRFNYFIDVESITRTTGSVDIDMRWKSSTGAILGIVGTLNVTATGMFEILPLASGFATSTDARPEASETVIAFVGDTSEFSGRIYLFAA